MLQIRLKKRAFFIGNLHVNEFQKNKKIKENLYDFHMIKGENRGWMFVVYPHFSREWAAVPPRENET